ncbi:MAG: ECF-type sigma factor [Acidobacteriota bacterium]
MTTDRDPPDPRNRALTAILEQWNEGSGDNVADDAMPLVYDQLRQIAQRFFRNERSNHTLQATAVVNEVYIRLQDETGVRFANRRHFVGRVAHMMRNLLVDYARERNASKRGGGWQRVTMMAAEGARQEPADLVALDDALLSLEAKDPEMARLVELRYFGGLTLEETAEVLGISRANVVLKWRRTRAWLHRELESKTPG